MNKKIMNKIKKSFFAFLIIAIFSMSFVIFSRDAKAADPSITVYDMVTTDTTPVIKGTVSDPTATVSVVIIGYVDRTATVAGDGSWTLQLVSGEALTAGEYAIGVASVIGGEMVSDSSWAYLNEEYPLELYFEEGDEILITSSIIFPDEYTFNSEDGNFSITFPAGTETTKTGGGSFDLSDWYSESVDFSNERIISKLHFGVSGISLSFSKDISITFNVGEEYEGQSLSIFSISDSNDDEGWEPMGISCDVTDGSCSFNTSHASYFAISQYHSIAETEEGMDNDNDDEEGAEKAKISKWKAYQYINNNGVSCPNKLILKIRGKHFDKNAKVKIGNIKAYSVDRKSGKKIVARFCINDLSKIKTGNRRTVSVTNPDADKEKADKKINLAKVDYKKFALNDLIPNTAEGIVNIQRALISLDFLDRQYDTGFYGTLTKNAVIEFQKQNSIFQTGYVGPLTKAMLVEKLK